MPSLRELAVLWTFELALIVFVAVGFFDVFVLGGPLEGLFRPVFEFTDAHSGAWFAASVVVVFPGGLALLGNVQLLLRESD
ncbi:hypothetical protein [Halospeciosus flavus]|uniref:Cox cluster protein n=1 Tax=Halospeciosus flavus TaxID=3032283 RepID=A0ABD5Z804_9EURY|nr:hypothetical protein [Halospeciosus flavus]